MTESLDGPAGTSKLGIASLALAIVALAAWWPLVLAPFIDVRPPESVVYIAAALAGVMFGAGAVVTGVIARRRGRRGDAGRGGIPLAGVVLGVVAAVLPAIMLLLVGYQIWAGYGEFQACVKGAGSEYPNYMCLKQCPEFLDSLCRSDIGWRH